MVLVLVTAAAVWFGPLGARHLLRSDEGRYAEIAREMLATGDWVTVRYQGLKYFEKPPLQLWATATAFRWFGVGDAQARLWVALNGAVAAVAVFVAARRWWGVSVAVTSAAVLLASPLWVVGGHLNSLDMGLSGALAGVLCAVLWAQAPGATAGQRRRGMQAAWIAMALAVLTKGPVGIVLPGLALVLYTALARDPGVWRRLALWRGALWLLAITVPWFWLVQDRNPEFARFFFIHEHWERYTSTVHHRSGPVWYFVPLIALGFAPWIGLWPAMVRVVWRSPEGLSPEPDRPPTPMHAGAAMPAQAVARAFRPAVWLAAWVIAIFGFFSASGSKLPGYILPVFPALALLAGAALHTLSVTAWRRQLAVAAVVAVAGAVACAGEGTLWRWTAEPEMHDFVRGLAGAAAVIAVGSVWAWALVADRRPDGDGRGGVGGGSAGSAGHAGRAGRAAASRMAYALAWLVGSSVGLLAHEAIGGPASGAALVPAIRRVLVPEMPIYSVRLLDHTLPWYLRRTTTVVESPDELEFGTQQEPSKWVPTLAAFEALWRQGPAALAVMSPQTHALLAARGLPMVDVAADARRVVVVNRPVGRQSLSDARPAPP